jgi:protein SCO1/2
MTVCDSSSHPTALSSLFTDGRPVILTLAYYRCPMLCDLVLRGLAAGIHDDASDRPGRDFRAVTVSIDPRDTWADAGRKQDQALDAAGATTGWTFFTADAVTSRRLADALGFHYAWDARTEQFAHPAVIFVLSGDGTIVRYLYGVDFPVRQLHLALLDAAAGRPRSLLDRVIMTCFHWDPANRRYGVFVAGFLRVGAALVLSGLVLLIGGLLLLERRARRVRHG